MSASNGERAPPKAQPNAPSYADLRRRVLLFASLFCVFVLLVAFAGFGVLRQSAIQAAEKRSRSYSTILSAHLDRTMNALESRLTQIGVQSDRLGGPGGNDARWLPVLQAARSGANTVVSLSVIDRDGVIRHSTLTPLVGRERREGTIYQSLDASTSPEILTETPSPSEFHDGMIMPFARRLISNGRVVGAVVAAFSAESLRDFYGSIDAEGGQIRLLHESGVSLLEEPRVVGQRISVDRVLESYRAGKASGGFIGLLGDGPVMITSYERFATQV